MSDDKTIEEAKVRLRALQIAFHEKADHEPENYNKPGYIPAWHLARECCELSDILDLLVPDFDSDAFSRASWEVYNEKRKRRP